jgi:ankyrin repeat protein
MSPRSNAEAISNLIWDRYLKHRDPRQFQDDLLTDPFYIPPSDASETLLMRAIEDSDLPAVELLLAMGHSPNLPAADGFTFLHQAVDAVSQARTEPKQQSGLAILTALLAAKADPDGQGMDGTPPHRAAAHGIIEAAAILIKYGANIEARTLTDGELTPLMMAAVMGQVNMVRFLLTAGANRLAVSGASLTEPPNLSLKQLLTRLDVSHKAEILELLEP